MTDRPAQIDLHLHTTVSDGTDTPPELLEKVKEAGISAFSVTDHDAVKAAGMIKEQLSHDSPRFIPGAEFSCRDSNGKYHILGYGFDPESAPIRALIDHGHGIRMKKIVIRIELLKTEFGISFSAEDVETLLSLDNPGKPHIGNLMVKYGYAKTKEQAIKEFINKIRVKSEYISPEEAIHGIIDGGGIPVLAHPFYGSGDELILGDEMRGRLSRLVGYGLRGIEAFYSGFSDKLRQEAISFADEFGLFITAGSDYHGTNKMVRLGDTGLEDVTEYPEGLKRFLEMFEK
ncbi:MAG: PHP domain-containing protein [Clostridia bacterium]|nr:PHP domain-containing protein [Clostridia bacterium]